MISNRYGRNSSHRWKYEKKNIVFIIKNDEINKSKPVFVSKNFTIYFNDSPISSTSIPLLKYEIVYTGYKIFSLLRTSDKRTAEIQINQMKNIVPILTTTATQIKPSICQPVVDAVINNPTWSECHIAASIGCTAFFTNTKLLPEEINATASPGMVTPLHLAVSRNYLDTLKAIIQLKPNINIVDDEGNTILHEASSGSIEILNEILKIPGIENLFPVLNCKKITAMAIACFEKKVINFKRFMAFGLPANLLYINSPNWKNDKIIKYNQKDLNSFDFSNISRGGCPLHWCKDSAAIDREINNGFMLDSLDLDNETPILVMIKKGINKAVFALAANGANVNLCDNQGNSPLHIATRKGDIFLMKSLLVFGSDINKRNILNESPLHIASIRGSPFDNPYRLLLLIHPLKCPENLCDNCNKRCLEPSYSKEFSMKSTTFQTLKSQKKLTNISLKSSETSSLRKIKNNLLKKKKNQKDKDSEFCDNRMLSIDGGGVKGLISIQTMVELESMLRYPINEYFNWFCGTSTGAIIAAALLQGKSLVQIRRMYWNFKDKIMTGKKPFDSNKLIKLFKEELLGDLPITDMRKLFGKHLMMTATNIRFHPPVLEMFRSFRNHRSIASAQETIELWEALRASTAAPMFFKSHRKFVDGGLIANNPTLDALTEFCRHRDCIEEENELESTPRPIPNLELVVSLGQSRVPPEKNNLVKLYDSLNLSIMNLMRSAFPGAKFLCEIVNQIKSLLLQTNEYVVHRAEAFCTGWNTLFYRISPVISTKLSLDETNDDRLIEALWNVKIYAANHSNEFRELAEVLNTLGPAPKIVDNLSENANIHMKIPYSAESIISSMSPEESPKNSPGRKRFVLEKNRKVKCKNRNILKEKKQNSLDSNDSNDSKNSKNSQNSNNSNNKKSITTVESLNRKKLENYQESLKIEYVKTDDSLCSIKSKMSETEIQIDDRKNIWNLKQIYNKNDFIRGKKSPYPILKK